MIWTTELLERYKKSPKAFKRDVVLNEILEDGGKFKEPFINNRRAPGIKFKMTPEEAKEYTKQIEDITFLLSKTKFPPRDHQMDMLNDIKSNRNNIFVVSRQIGTSITSMFAALHYIINNSNRTVLILNPKSSGLSDSFYQLLDVYDMLPYFIKPGITSSDVDQIEFENGSKIKFRTTKRTFGFGIDFLILQDIAHNIDNEKIIKNIIPTVTASVNGKVLIYSTPNGHNEFYKFYKNSNFHKRKIPYTVFDIRNKTHEEFRKEKIMEMGGDDTAIMSFEQEYNCKFFNIEQFKRNQRINSII